MAEKRSSMPRSFRTRGVRCRASPEAAPNWAGQSVADAPPRVMLEESHRGAKVSSVTERLSVALRAAKVCRSRQRPAPDLAEFEAARKAGLAPHLLRELGERLLDRPSARGLQGLGARTGKTPQHP